MAVETLVKSELEGISLVSRGKVRDIYDLGDKMLIVTTDRISAFDVVLPEGIPGKGKVLNQLSVFWFGLLGGVCRDHLITADFSEMPKSLHPFRSQLEGRSMLVRKVKIFPVECIVRGYITGSAWKEYRSSGTVNGTPMPAGMRESERFPAPMFTPSTKAETGHDENISFDKMCEHVGKGVSEKIRELSLALYAKASEHALSKGIIICDTKFEFGWHDKDVMLADEVLTPDSSRFWPRSSYRAGAAQPSFDKQYVRDYLESLKWDKRPPAPHLPEEVVRKTSEKYMEAFKLITGKDLAI